MTGVDQAHAALDGAASHSGPASVSLHRLRTADGAIIDGVLRRGAGTGPVISMMHPRTDQTHHPLAAMLVAAGYSVWTQVSRSPNNDVNLLHELALVDYACGQRFLREQAGFSTVVSLGHSGGGTLSAFYHQQANLAREQRLRSTPGGRPVPLNEIDMPCPDLAVFVAAHPGQGRVLMRMIDPSVIDEEDPMSIDPALDAFDAANGFATPPQSSTYSDQFIEVYREAQRARVARLDARAREMIEERHIARERSAAHGDLEQIRRSVLPHIMKIFRTDADLASTDLGIDPNARPYGSLFGGRPHITNFGLVGFARLCTPEAWLSTWSGLSSRASFTGCAGGVRAPALFVQLDGDQACLPRTALSMVAAIGSDDVTHRVVSGTHFGGPLRDGRYLGYERAASEIVAWLQRMLSERP